MVHVSLSATLPRLCDLGPFSDSLCLFCGRLGEPAAVKKDWEEQRRCRQARGSAGARPRATRMR
eukprot:7441400-Pyramimonas_sp.AAC.1